MDQYDDLQRLRVSRAASRDGGSGPTSGSGRAFVGKVTTAMPAVGEFLLLQPVTVLGAESEGSAGSFTPPDTAARVAAYLLGPGVPVTGDYLVARSVDNRWVVERSGRSGYDYHYIVDIPGCFCDPLPATIGMSVSDPTADFGLFQPCTIVYGPTPAMYNLLLLGPNCYLSTTTFPDAVNGGAPYSFLLTCSFNTFSLSRVYADLGGTQFRDGILYSWVIALGDNTCVPFHMGTGLPFPGSDPEVITLDG